MVYAECPMVPVGVVRDRAVPAGRPAHLQRPQRWATGPGRIPGRRRRWPRWFRPDHAGRQVLPETQVPENLQTIASGMYPKWFIIIGVRVLKNKLNIYLFL